MKTLDEIINRKDYIRMNNALIERAHEVALIIRKKMMQIGMKASKSAPGIALKEINRYMNGECIWCGISICYREEITDPEDRYYYQLDGREPFRYYSIDERTSSNESVNDEADSKMLLYFLNNVRNILDEIDELETEKVGEIEKAINAVSNI